MPFGIATLGFKLLGIGKAIGGAVKAGARWTLSDMRHIAIVVLAATVGVLAWNNSGLRHTVQRHEWREAGFLQFARDVGIASAKSRAEQIALNQAQEAAYIANKEKADERHKKALIAADSRLSVYIAANRVRPAKGSGDSIGADPAAQGQDTGLPETMPQGSVMVGEADLRALDELAQIGLSAIEWADSLIADGVAE